MRTIFRNRGPMRGRHTVYESEKEARDAGIVPVHWKEAKQGDWLLSDDGLVVEVMSRTKYRRGGTERAFLVTPVCRVWVNKDAALRIGDYLWTKKFSATSADANADRQEARLTRTRNAVKAYAVMLADEKPVDWDKLGRIYRPDQRNPGASARRLLLRNPAVARLVRKEMAEAFSPDGATVEYVVRTLKEAVRVAEQKGDSGAMIRGVAAIAKLIGM